MSAASQASCFYQISASVDNVKHIFVHLQRAKNNNKAENPYLFDTCKLNAADNNSYLTTFRSEYGNVVFYSQTEYDTESKVRIFNDLMSYAKRKNDFNTGTQLNFANYNSLYSLMFRFIFPKRKKLQEIPIS